LGLARKQHSDPSFLDGIDAANWQTSNLRLLRPHVLGSPAERHQGAPGILVSGGGLRPQLLHPVQQLPRVRRPLARPRQDHRDDDGRVRVRRLVRRPVPGGGTRHLPSHLPDVHHPDQHRLDEPDGGAGRQRHPDLADGEPRQEAGEAGGLLGTVGEGPDVETLPGAARSPDRQEASREELHRDQVRVGDVDEVPPLEEALLQAYR
jgi:hypothetical protein